MSWKRRAFRYVAVLAIVSFGMAVVQWLAAPRGGGAGDYAVSLQQQGYDRTAAVLLRLHESTLLRAADDWWQRVLNAPRNRLLAGIGVIERPDMIYFYGASHRWPSEDFRLAVIFAVSTVVIGSPLMFLAAWIVTARMKRAR